MPDTAVLFQHLGLSLALGLLVGLQRERAGSGLAGFRTYPLITVLGTMCAVLDGVFGGWVVPVGLLGVVGVVIVGNLSPARRHEATGTTSEFAVLLMFAVGAFIHVGPWIVAVAVGAGVAVLLQFKPELHGLARRLSDDDISAVMRFVLITCVVLPVLPNRPLTERTPWNAINPFEIWLMVVLIVGISLGGYVCYRLFGQRAGIVLSGVLGGAISSTATTASYSRRAATAQIVPRLAAVVIAIAAVVVFARVLGEIAVVSPKLLTFAAPPLLVTTVAGIVPLVFVWLRDDRETAALAEQKNPTEIRSALAFAALYGLVKLALAAAHEYLHIEGVYLVAALSGLTDMDAITLSSARLFEAGGLSAGVAWRLVLTAAISNLVFKAGIVAALGGRPLFRIVAALFAAPVVASLALIWFWP